MHEFTELKTIGPQVNLCRIVIPITQSFATSDSEDIPTSIRRIDSWII